MGPIVQAYNQAGGDCIESCTLTMEAVKAMKDVDIRTVDPETLRDIRDVQVRTELPKKERMLDFIRQIGNPY